jgi:outer membrane immunogenic protein
MKSVVCAAFLALMLAPPALAAGKKSPAFSWTGFYLGIQGGYGWTGTATAGILDPFNALGPGAGTGTPGTFLFDPNASGGIVGAHAGYNWQAYPNLVVGGEVDWSWANINGATGASPIPYPKDLRPGTSVDADLDIHSLGSARGRLGYARPTCSLTSRVVSLGQTTTRTAISSALAARVRRAPLVFNRQEG